ncbi:MAG: hypothetical protein H8E13_12340 [Actinobacteria bacterium]|nr:hypothetical protein [Actinomycetota bacterium]
MGSVKEEDKSKREKSLLEKYSREELGLMPLFCPKCSKMMKGKLDKKM